MSACGVLLWQTAMYLLERPKQANTARQRAYVDTLYVVVSVPAYNEDPEVLRRCLASTLHQSRPPQMVYVVDDGSTKVDYTELRAWFEQTSPAYGVRAVWERKPNGGKRSAQGRCIEATPYADVYVTVDSDVTLDDQATAQLLAPFSDTAITSVAGVVLAANNRRNLLTRMTDLWFVLGQLVGRSAMSTMGSVLVNSGAVAAYRGWILRENLHAYLNETFFGREVRFSDDSMLTLYALDHGRTVQQPTAFAFTMVPERVGHHLRVYLRWMRGSTIRSIWRFRYLPLTRYAYWSHLLNWASMVIATLAVIVIAAYRPVVGGTAYPHLLLIPVLIGYCQSLRYLAITRTDDSVASQLATWLLSPLLTIWGFTVLRIVRWYAMATCWNTGSWGTREQVEVSIKLPSLATSEVPETLVAHGKAHAT